MKEFAQQFLDVVGVTLAAAVAALVGAIGGLALADDRPSPRQSVWIVFLGLGVGAFGSRLLEGVLPGWGANALAFFLALCGMPIAGFMFAVANHFRRRAASIADRGVDKILGPDAHKDAAPPPPQKDPLP